MARYLATPAGPATRADRGDVEAALAAERPFWLDVRNPREDDFALLHEVFRFHPLAVEDSEHFGQRAKLDPYDDVAFVVVFGFSPDEDGIVEVHCFATDRYLVSVHRDAAPALDRMRERCAHGLLSHPTGPGLLYHLVDGLVDGFFPALDELAERLDAVESGLLTRPDESHLAELLEIRQRLTALQRVVGPQRDLLSRVLTGIEPLPGLTADLERYYRDVHDHLIRIDDAIDTHREHLVAATGVYLTTTSHRLNHVVKQLTAIATIFLPLTFVTGFFGQNFGWLVDAVGSAGAFVGLGIGLELVAVVVLLAYFKRQRWF
jgi:magnesium transporter